MTSNIRLFFLGGLTSYRALFTWLSPWILIPTFLIGPISQILLFAYVGRSAGLADDGYFVIGNAVQYAAIPCLFAMGNTIGSERQQSTLALLLASPARRIPLFLGRALPVIVNGWVVARRVGGGSLLDVPLLGRTLLPLAFVVGVCSFACTGLGLVTGALALRVRETAVLVNIVFAVLLIFAGVNIPIGTLPAWMAGVAHWLPMTHGIAAARSVAAGAALGDVQDALLTEAGLGLLYLTAGLVMLRVFEAESRRRATLDVAGPRTAAAWRCRRWSARD